MDATKEQPGNPQRKALGSPPHTAPAHIPSIGGRDLHPHPGTPSTQIAGVSSPFPDTAFRTLPTKEGLAWYGVRHAGVRQAGVQARRGVCQPGVRGAGVQALLLSGASSSFRGEREHGARAQLATALYCPGEPEGVSKPHHEEPRVSEPPPPRPPSCPRPQGRGPTSSCRAALRQSASS